MIWPGRLRLTEGNRRAAVLACLAAVNVVAAAMSQWLLYEAVGIGRQTDALIASMAIPAALHALALGPLSNVLVPTFSNLARQEHRREASSLAIFALATGLPFVVLAYATAPGWVPWLFPGFAPAHAALVIRLTRIQLLGLAIALPQGVVVASVLAQDRFIIAEAAQAVVSALCMAFIMPVAAAQGVLGVAWLFSIRMALRSFSLLPASLIRPIWRPQLVHSRSAIPKIWPLLSANALRTSESLLDQMLASMASAGALSLLNLTRTLYTALLTVFNRTVSTPAFPLLSRLAKSNSEQPFLQCIRKRSRTVLLVGGAGFTTLLFFGHDLLGRLVGYGGITDGNHHELFALLVAMAGLPIGQAWNQIYGFGFYSVGASNLFAAITVGTLCMGLVMKIVSFQIGGVIGLALATSVLSLITAVTSRGLLLRRIRAVGLLGN